MSANVYTIVLFIFYHWMVNHLVLKPCCCCCWWWYGFCLLTLFILSVLENNYILKAWTCENDENVDDNDNCCCLLPPWNGFNANLSSSWSLSFWYPPHPQKIKKGIIILIIFRSAHPFTRIMWSPISLYSFHRYSFTIHPLNFFFPVNSHSLAHLS